MSGPFCETAKYVTVRTAFPRITAVNRKQYFIEKNEAYVLHELTSSRFVGCFHFKPESLKQEYT
jgi:hypothetical protein